MDTLLAGATIALAIVEALAYVAIVFRHAIPRAPRLFAYLVTPPMLASVASLVVLAVLGASSRTSMFNMPQEIYMLVFRASNVCWLSVLLAYSFYWYMHGRNRAEQ